MTLVAITWAAELVDGRSTRRGSYETEDGARVWCEVYRHPTIPEFGWVARMHDNAQRTGKPLAYATGFVSVADAELYCQGLADMARGRRRERQ
jgi:hypothetical protein